jgi:hypothetical protein
MLPPSVIPPVALVKARDEAELEVVTVPTVSVGVSEVVLGPVLPVIPVIPEPAPELIVIVLPAVEAIAVPARMTAPVNVACPVPAVV